MTYRGHVENGVIVLDEPATLEEGTPVRIEVAIELSQQKHPTLAEQLGDLIGSCEGLPADWSENHDKYLREPPA